MKSGMNKPPLAPKPNLSQLQPVSALTPGKYALSNQAAGQPQRVKPMLAPKPNPSKLNSKPIASKILPTTITTPPQMVGRLNTQNGMQNDSKKPNWDYIIPICLCNQKDCRCIRDNHIDKVEKDFKTFPIVKSVENEKNTSPERKTDNTKRKVTHVLTANGQLPNHNPPRESSHALDKCLNKNLNTSSPHINVKLLPFRTVNNEANCNVITRDDTNHVPVGETNRFEQKQQLATPSKHVPVPVPRKPKNAFLAHQEKVEEKAEITVQEGRKMNELKVSSEGKGRASSSVNVTAGENRTSLSSASTPAPTPRKIPYLSAPENAPSPAQSMLQNNVEEEDLGWDSTIYDMELSVDKEEEELEVESKGTRNLVTASKDQTDVNFRSNSPGNNFGAVKLVPTKPRRNNSPMSWMKKTESLDVGKELKSGINVKSQKIVMADLPLLPEKTKTTHESTPAATSGKQRPRSFSGIDLVRSEGRRSSFRKLLDLKLSVMMLPKLMTKGSQTLESNDQDIPHDLQCALAVENKYSCPLVGVEQSVDCEELCPTNEQDANYENICFYEEITDYENIYFGGSEGSSVTWQSLYNDDGIYEEPESFLSPDKNTDYDRSSIDEEVDDGASDDDFMISFSDVEAEDDSSVSSKGDHELPEESATQSGPRMTKIHHIATEIMTSEKVFVDVLKLLHVDFRDAVDKASQQNGKPVIEERLLNQILYYLPQLYELNQDLLQELQNRLAKWDENKKLADIFLKKGPYLKMYSTYIREFDKNVALLEEQSKKNPLFGAVVREFEADPRCANLALKHYLLKPIQRIPQYQLLLRDYLKNLSKDSADYKDTQTALAIVKEVANHANDIMKQGDNFQKLIQVQCSLNGHHEIVQPGRIFLKEGMLNKLSRKVMHPRMFFLFNDILLYTTPVQSGQYKFNSMLSLAGMKVSKPSQEACQNEFLIESVERSFILSASSASERDEWLEVISTAISDYTKKKITFISGKSFDEVQLSDGADGASLGAKAPIWIPDPRATMCMICTCEFTLTWRRHHCRACGKVVCQSCSSNKQSLEYLKNQLARVCDQCYLVLREQKSEEDASAAALPKAPFTFSRKQKRIPAALKEVSASTDNPSMSGYLQRSKGKKKQGKRLWFVIKDKVLYTYAASEDVAALESQPLLGFVLKADSSQKLQFKLYHKNTLYYNFKADDIQTAQRWINTFRESAVL
ncbi:FYVE, RhoGEF and PH domain-containing protein 6-like [Corythoichthys intestinalis]|uniref:FYVE, RhoGEF and PH domain-containing protein 6-like n=1 Tax=Corythoichthys intestinalis TaxID=161448 RepID=UPI0025A67006|nr:FYVE, RhoGEF and PH domain-containing protein 6-like [Corythoichthys intestinalis]